MNGHTTKFLRRTISDLPQTSKAAFRALKRRYNKLPHTQRYLFKVYSVIAQDKRTTENLSF